MSFRVATTCVAVVLAVQATTQTQDLLVLEWADQARDRTAIFGDPVFMRTLYCDNKQGPIACDIIEVVLSRTICPLVVQDTRIERKQVTCTPSDTETSST